MLTQLVWSSAPMLTQLVWSPHPLVDTAKCWPMIRPDLGSWWVVLADYEKTTYICTTQQLNDYSLPLIPTPPLIMAVNIGEAVCFPLPSNSPWNIAPWLARLAGGQLTGRGRGAGRQIESHTDNLTWTNLSAPASTIDEKIAAEAVFYRNIIDLSRRWPLLTVCGVLSDAEDDGIIS